MTRPGIPSTHTNGQLRNRPIRVRIFPQRRKTNSITATTSLKEAAEAGFYKPPGLEDRYPRIQILTIEQLLAGKRVEYPRLLEVTFKKAPKARPAAEKKAQLQFDPVEDDKGPF